MLLKNHYGALPLKAGAKVAVIGPQGVARYGLVSDYYNDEVCWSASCRGKACFDCIPTIAEAVVASNVGGTISFAKAVDVNSADASGVSTAGLEAGAVHPWPLETPHTSAKAPAAG